MFWKDTLHHFWADFKRAVDDTKELRITDVLNHLDAELGPHFFPVTEANPEPRKCPTCSEGKLSLKLGKFGAFIGCSRYPDCKHTQPLVVPDESSDGEDGEDGTSSKNASFEPKELGIHPETGRSVSLRKGPYGPYVQIDPAPESKDKPKRQGLPKGMNMEDVTLEAALSLLALPRDVGLHPETGDMIESGIGRFGPFLKHGKTFVSLPKGDEVLTVGLNRAVDLIAEHAIKKAKKEAEKAEKGTATKTKAKPKKKATKAKAKAKKKA